MGAAVGHLPAKVVEYDAFRRRVWILGQRCHHGATGLLVVTTACLALITESQPQRRSMFALAVTGGALMAHDWKDRSIWFERGRGSQP